MAIFTTRTCGKILSVYGYAPYIRFNGEDRPLPSFIDPSSRENSIYLCASSTSRSKTIPCDAVLAL